MTNRENLILSLEIMGQDEQKSMDALQRSPFEDFAPAESTVAYSVACPYSAADRPLPCDGLIWPWSKLTVCGPCINRWLDEEVSE